MDNNSRLFFALKNARHVKKGRLIQPAVQMGKIKCIKTKQKGYQWISKQMERLKTTYFTLLALTISMFQGLVFPFIMMFHKKKPCNIQKRLFQINHSATKPYNFAIQFWLIRSIQQIHKSDQSTCFFHIISPTEKPPCSNLVRGWNTLKHHMSSYLTPTRNTKIAVD